jgi:hypothetical protein
MANRGAFTRLSAIFGTILVWLPLLAPFVLAIAMLFSRHRFLFDYLMPAELFPLGLAGGALLLWAALRLRAHRGLIGWSFFIAVGMWFGFQLLAQVLGLASGEHEPEGWRLGLVLTGLAIYILALAATGVGGILLTRVLYSRRSPAA